MLSQSPPALQLCRRGAGGTWPGTDGSQPGKGKEGCSEGKLRWAECGIGACGAALLSSSLGTLIMKATPRPSFTVPCRRC